jgi:hypothetical protein
MDPKLSQFSERSLSMLYLNVSKHSQCCSEANLRLGLLNTWIIIIYAHFLNYTKLTTSSNNVISRQVYLEN